MATKNINADSVVKPQSLSFFVTEPGRPPEELSLLTVYTGILGVGHGSEDDKSTLTVLYPIVNGERQLQKFETEGQFGPAVVVASLATVLVKDTNSVSAVEEADVGLREVLLAPSSPAETALVAVLTAKLASTESEVIALSYQVTLLTRFPGRLPAPVEIDGAIWDGSYHSIGPVIKRGDPAP